MSKGGRGGCLCQPNVTESDDVESRCREYSGVAPDLCLQGCCCSTSHKWNGAVACALRRSTTWRVASCARRCCRAPSARPLHPAPRPPQLRLPPSSRTRPRLPPCTAAWRVLCRRTWTATVGAAAGARTRATAEGRRAGRVRDGRKDGSGRECSHARRCAAALVIPSYASHWC
jgi:hypothetical protein